MTFYDCEQFLSCNLFYIKPPLTISNFQWNKDVIEDKVYHNMLLLDQKNKWEKTEISIPIRQ